MLEVIAVFLLSFGWLLFETDCLRLRLPCGKAKSNSYIECLTKAIDNQWIEIEKYLTIKLTIPQLFYKPLLMLPQGITRPKFAQYKVLHSIKSKLNATLIHEGNNFPADSNSNMFNITTYEIYLSPGIEPMCGYDWLDRHCGDMLDFKQHIEMNIGNVRYTMDIKSPEILTDVMKANKLSKQEKLKLQHSNPLLDYGNKIIRRKSKKFVGVR